jgi:hypothetical protein
MEERPPIYCASSRGQPTRSGPPAWGLGEVLTSPHPKTDFVTKYEQFSRAWTDTLVQPKQRKREMTFGTWNVDF